MNRKFVILAVSAILVCVAVAAGLVALLYAGTGKKGGSEIVSQQGFELLSSVPTDAIAVVMQENLQSTLDLYCEEGNLAWAPLASAASPSFRNFSKELSKLASDRQIQSLKGASSVVSFHYVGELLPLLILKDPKGGAERSSDAARVLDLADTLGLYSCWADSRILVSTSDVVLQSALRHQSSDASVADSPGFEETAASVNARNVVLVNVENCGKIFSTIVAKSYLKHADFYKTLGSWAAFSLDQNSPERATMSGVVNCSDGVRKYMKIFDSAQPSESQAAAMLPEKTSWAFTIPSADMEEYVKAYQSYGDSRIGLSRFLSRQKELQTATGMAPKAWFNSLGVREAVVAEMNIAGNQEQVMLLKVANPDENCAGGVNEFPYGGFVASVIGGLYKLPDESCCTFVDGWLIIGSNAVVSAYSEGEMPGTKLSESAAFASHADKLAGKNQLAMFWFPLTGNSALVREMFQKSFGASLEATSYGKEETFLASLAKTKTGVVLTMDMTKPDQQLPRRKRNDAEEQEITVPSGPFTVKNSGTGKDNLLSCSDGRLVLTEDGNELWTVPFDGAFCGRVANVDYYNNKKIQFAFCSGDKLYLYDRLGRVVDGFPVTLDKPVVLGPDVYDFRNVRRYSAVVLNMDNTIDMYNLKGQKVDGWKTIVPKDKVTSLPESILVGKKNYLVVYTASQTFVYGLDGGEPVAEFEGHVPADQIELDQK